MALLWSKTFNHRHHILFCFEILSAINEITKRARKKRCPSICRYVVSPSSVPFEFITKLAARSTQLGLLRSQQNAHFARLSLTQIIFFALPPWLDPPKTANLDSYSLQPPTLTLHLSPTFSSPTISRVAQINHQGHTNSNTTPVQVAQIGCGAHIEPGQSCPNRPSVLALSRTFGHDDTSFSDILIKNYEMPFCRSTHYGRRGIA